MKALTLTQPWATLVAIGAKTIETRSWATSYRGPLAIHAAAGYGKGGAKAHKALCGTEPFCSVLNAACKAHYDALDTSGGVLRAMAESPFMPMGMIVATCDLVDCVQVLYEWPHNQIVSIRSRHCLTDQERAFGDYTPGRYTWLLTNIRALEKSIPAKGALSLWEYEGAL
jgi:hypothetical protein